MHLLHRLDGVQAPGVLLRQVRHLSHYFKWMLSSDRKLGALNFKLHAQSISWTKFLRMRRTAGYLNTAFSLLSVWVTFTDQRCTTSSHSLNMVIKIQPLLGSNVFLLTFRTFDVSEKPNVYLVLYTYWLILINESDKNERIKSTFGCT